MDRECTKLLAAEISRHSLSRSRPSAFFYSPMAHCDRPRRPRIMFHIAIGSWIVLLVWVVVTVEKRRHRFLCRRAGATPRTFWAAGSQKSGVAPARFSLFSTVIFGGIAFHISFLLNKVASPQGDEGGDGEGGGCIPCLLHPSPLGPRSGALNRRSISVLKCAMTGRLVPPNS